MDERITIRLNAEAKEEFAICSSRVSSDVSHILRGFIEFINSLSETEAATFLTMLKEFKAHTQEREEAIATLRG